MARSHHAESDPTGDRDRRDYPVLEQLDRLEELLEEMDELGVTTRDEIERRISELERRLDDE